MKKTSIKNLIFIIAAVVVLLVLYILFIKPDNNTSSNSALTSSVTGESPSQARTESTGATPGDSLLRILNNLETLELNDSIFFNPAFDTLRDISIPLVKEGNAGRRNPFAPIGSDPVPLPINNGSVGEDLSEGESGDNGEEDFTTDEEEDFGLFGS